MAEQAKHEWITPEKVEKLEHRLSQVSMGYDTGTLARVYTQDVRYLLKEIELLRAESQTTNKMRDDLIDTVSRHCEQLTEQANRLQAAEEGRNLWRRDCEIAQARVMELERRQSEGLDKPTFDWPWVAQVGTPAECMNQCLTLIAHTVRMLCVDGKLNAEQEAVRDKANELLVLFGDPLAPKQVLESRTVNWPTAPTESEIKQARNDMELM